MQKLRQVEAEIMPIKIPDKLPAAKVLKSEGVQVMAESRALRQDIRPLEIVILNLMPEKIKTETQLARLLGATPLQINVTFLRTASYEARHTAKQHLEAFYKVFDEIKAAKFDGLIITGAPIEHLPFEEVIYWPELAQILDWAKSHSFASLFICWGAQAALYHYHGVPKYALADKRFGVYEHARVGGRDPLVAGLSDRLPMPVSRYTEVRQEDLPEKLTPLLVSDTAGLGLVTDAAQRRAYIFNHLEYDSDTLASEYQRDQAAGKPIRVPANYFPDDEPGQRPLQSWRSHAHMLFGNWLNLIYQNTPFRLSEIGAERD